MKEEQTTQAVTAQEQEQHIHRLAELLSLDADTIRSMVGSRVRGSAQFGRDGSFSFRPSEERGTNRAVQHQTAHGSTLSRTLARGRLSLCCTAPEGETDPEAWIAQEVNTLLSQSGTDRTISIGGRILMDTPPLRLSIDARSAQLQALIQLPLHGLDAVPAMAAATARLLSAVSLKRTDIAAAVQRAERAATRPQTRRKGGQRHV